MGLEIQMATKSDIEEGLSFRPKFDERGLIPVVTVDSDSNEVLMVANMNAAALEATLSSGKGTYFSRSRNKLWVKGEQSGHVQTLKEIRIDCDSDVVLMQVEQIGGIACHTGRHNCFYKRYEQGEWREVEPVLKDTGEIYRS